ncbi:aldo/keto reductase [Enterococcus cecorum]|uniref:aldo/keto reductase n=1 Tax=Enterococcus cecorum TaxID=44008 RepID=UPI001FACE35D|nr:aldo/keto reductase [Enterococcus cecorum]MCJ0537076.1 aldo/keto reductase [Enterococcus cecorum]MCJ0544856.1 aldo/keto reductase [Enterococcus cecorum]MCJ0551205.1 aldo/keto reductase [Enterococcus cecorum]MCJ0569155.1 aldo/keto reductase [Enterococcus cecorum]
MFNKSMKLNNGVVIPQLALGTWLIDDEKVTDAVKSALQMGYRHIDTAQAYGNERGVGEGVRQSGIPRDEIFITSKVAAEHKSYESAAKSIDDTLKLMGMDYLDMMIIHSPQPWKEVNQSENRYKKENQEVWRALEDALEAGKLRAIGVSNFLEEDVQNILKTARIKPQVNQILAHISNTPLDLIQYCQNEGIAVEAYSPVAHGEALKNPKIVAMAKKYGVSVAQLCIRYCIQLDMIVLPKTANPDHMRENADLDFEISQEDMKELLAIDKIQDYGEASFFPVYGGKL